MVAAALAAEGTSVVTRLDHIDRGYEKIEEAAGRLGGDIRRV